ncbi:HTH-type transcriptional activator RhaR [compost metagenome]
MSINHYYADLPLSESFANLADEEVDIRLIDLRGEQDCLVRAESAPSLSLAYYEQGGGWRQFADTAPLALRDRSCCFYHSSVAVRGEGWMPAGVQLRGVNISFAPQVLARLGVSDDPFTGEMPWERAVSADSLARLLQFPAPPALRRVGLQMLDCQLQGVTRDIFLRGKALEMLAEMLGYLRTSGPREALSGRDLGRLQRARELLGAQLDQPWTIESLAVAVELSTRKLKEGFRHLHGMGVYALLQKLRMEQAALRLQAGERVAEVALAVGYSNASHFAKVFRHHYGSAPRDFARSAGGGWPFIPGCSP